MLRGNEFGRAAGTGTIVFLLSWCPAVEAQTRIADVRAGLERLSNTVSGLRAEVETIAKIFGELSSFITGLSVLVAVVTFVFGLILATNLFAGSRVVMSARKEIKEVETLRKEYETRVGGIDGIVQEKMEQLETHAREVFDAIERRQHESFVVNRKKKELLELLAEERPDGQAIFPKLTDVVGYPDATSFRIFRLCLEKFGEDEDIRRVVARGLGELGGMEPPVA